MISSVSDYHYVTGANVDEDHPHGDLDRILIDGDIMPLREGTTSETTGVDRSRILRGEDICFCYEALAEIARFYSSIYLPYGCEEVSGSTVTLSPGVYPSSGSAKFDRRVGNSTGEGFVTESKGGLRGLYESYINFSRGIAGVSFRLLKSSVPTGILPYGDAASHNSQRWYESDIQSALTPYAPPVLPYDPEGEEELREYALRKDYVSCYFNVLLTYMNHAAAIFTSKVMCAFDVENYGTKTFSPPTPFATYIFGLIVSGSEDSTGTTIYNLYTISNEPPFTLTSTDGLPSPNQILYCSCSWGGPGGPSGSGTYALARNAPITRAFIESVMSTLGVTPPTPAVGVLWQFSLAISYAVESTVYQSRIDWSQS